MRQVRIAGNVFLLLKGEEGKALLMPYLLVVTLPLCVIFAPVIHSVSKDKWEDLEGGNQQGRKHGRK